MCLIRRRHWDRCQQCGRTDNQHRGSFPADTEGRSKAVDVKMRLWSPEDRVLG